METFYEGNIMIMKYRNNLIFECNMEWKLNLPVLLIQRDKGQKCTGNKFK